MRLTTKGRFAVTAMMDVAMHGGSGPGHAGRRLRAAEDLAVLPRAALRQAAPLRAGRERARAGGGYNLAKPHDRVSVADIILAVDEPIDATQCGGKENCHDDRRCMTHDLWAALNDHIFAFLSGVTLAQLVEAATAERRSRCCRITGRRRQVRKQRAASDRPLPAP